MSEETGAFSKRTLYLLISVGVLSLLFGFGLAIFGGGVGQPPTAESNTYSRSALGHHALIKFLHALEVPLVTSQHDSGDKAQSALVVLLEPNVHDDNRQDARDMIDSAEGVLLVLPKWQGEQDEEHPDQVTSVALIEPEQVLDALVLLDQQATLYRPQTLGQTHSSEAISALPTLAAPQLLRSSNIDAILSVGDGILFGKVTGEDIWILSDPDILNNHGLDNGQNALLASQIIDEARGGRTVVIDETLHGFLRKPDMWRALFEMPFVLVTIQVFLCVLLLIWGGTARFGKALIKAPSIGQGTAFLIGNTARLMRLGGHSGLALSRYRLVTLRAVAKSLHAPRGLELGALYEWLARIETNRSIKQSLSSIAQEIDDLVAQKSPDSDDLLKAARHLYRWKEEILNGPTTD